MRELALRTRSNDHLLATQSFERLVFKALMSETPGLKPEISPEIPRRNRH